VWFSGCWRRERGPNQHRRTLARGGAEGPGGPPAESGWQASRFPQFAQSPVGGLCSLSAGGEAHQAAREGAARCLLRFPRAREKPPGGSAHSAHSVHPFSGKYLLRFLV
jgi:hypothetical protein